MEGGGGNSSYPPGYTSGVRLQPFIHIIILHLKHDYFVFSSFFDLRKEFRNYLASVDGHITVDPENPNSSILPVKQMLQCILDDE